MKITAVLLFTILTLVIITAIISGGCSEPVKTEIPAASVSPTASPPVEQQQIEALKVGDKAPSFILKDIDGKTVALRDFEGEKVIINIWIMGCHGCTDEMPFFQEFYNKYGDNKPVLIGINTTNSAAMVKSFASTNGLSFILLVDTGGTLDKSYSITGVPTTFFLDGQGLVKAIKDGMFESTSEIEELYGSY